MNGRMYAAELEETLNQVFSPSSPIQKEQFFLGRLDELTRVVDAVNERGQHVVVYGERGVGKTSFANVVATKINNLFSVSVTCSAVENYSSIWRKALSKVRFQRNRGGLGFIPVEMKETVQLDFFVKDDCEVSPIDVQFILENLDYNLLFIFDEYDVVVDPEVHRCMAETLKNISDNCNNVTIMLVGVGRNVSDLLEQHRSIDRCLAQVRLERMRDDDIFQILDRSENHIKMVFKNAVKKEIVSISSGFPHFTHLLGKLSAKAAFLKNAALVDESHLNSAIELGLERADESTRIAYQKATFSSHNTCKVQDILSACSLVETDEHMSFRGTDVKKSYKVVSSSLTSPANMTYYLNDLCKESRGSILERIEDGRRVRYKFKNPFVRAYCKMKIRS